MTELQSIQFDIIKTADYICNQLGICYYLVCGTALGAVKYHGFIPWDDDVDIAMFRKDYDYFLSEAPKYLNSPYFLQNYKSDARYPFIFSKLRNSDTTYIEKSTSRMDINHGVYIDIFPLDEYPNGKVQKLKLESKKKLITYMIFGVYDVKTRFWSGLLQKVDRLLKFDEKTQSLVKKYENAVAYYPGARSDIICNHGNWQGKREYAPIEQYGKGTWAMFEGLRVRVPEQYDKYLTQKYGDWRAELPKEQQIGHHYYEICDLTRPYTDYITVLPNGKIKVKKP